MVTDTASNTELILAFVNSLDRPVESFDSPAALAGWLAGRGLAPQGLEASDGDLAAAISLREALRTLVAAHNELPVDTAPALAVLDDAARRAGLGVRFGADSARLEPAQGGVDGALGRILAAVAATMADGTWLRLKACRDEDCLWVFLDTAKNRSRAWCSMRSCGNRAKVRAYRERQAVSERGA